MKSMYIGSGDVGSLLMGKHTDGHGKLLRRFVSDEKQRFNAKASPIDAFRTGAILEERFFETLDDSYYPQYFVRSEEMSVLTCTIDFGKIDAGVLVDFIELKTCNFEDFLLFEQFRDKETEAIDFIKKYYKKNYAQVQHQLFCSKLESAELVFLAVYSYIDEENYARIIQPNEFLKFRIKRDETVISEIKERSKIFQTIKDYYSE